MTTRKSTTATDAEVERLLAAPSTPAHLDYIASQGTFAFPAWLQYVNLWVTEFLMDPGPRFGIIEASTRHGKAMKATEMILTTVGWREARCLVPGDEVFGPDGQPTKILVVGPIGVDAPKMRVSFSDGTSLDVHPRHEWTVLCSSGNRAGERPVRTYETQHLARLETSRRRRQPLRVSTSRAAALADAGGGADRAAISAGCMARRWDDWAARDQPGSR